MESSVKSTWGIDPTHSEVSFKVKHLMITNVKGTFKGLEASVITEGSNFITANIDFHLDASTVDTGVADRDTHLRSADFFDTENHKQISFNGKSAGKADADGNYELIGDLTIKGVTNEVKLDVEFAGLMTDPWGNQKAGYAINGKINRKDWGLNWNAALEAGGLLVSDEVRISCEIQLIKQA